MDDSPRGTGTGRYGEKEKIPRPRNAFILFRQHHHRLLIDEWTSQGVEIPHNSKISKLLGVKWKELAAEEKTHWKELAEKEKTDHEKKYPDYRYKPVRKQRKKRDAVQAAPAAPPPQQPVVQHHRPNPPGLLPFNNYTRPGGGEPHGSASAGSYFLPKATAGAQTAHMQPYYVQQPYPYNYYTKTTTSAPAATQVYPAPMPLPLQIQMQMQMQLQAQQRNSRDAVPEFSYHPGYQHHHHQHRQQHRLWSPQQIGNSTPNQTTKLHPAVSSTPVFQDFQNNLNPGHNQSQDPTSH